MPSVFNITYMKTDTHNSYVQSINRVIDYINNHLDEPIEVAMLARIANISTFHFCRVFKALRGESPIAYIARLRIETAAQLLRYTSLPVEAIAFNVGYETPASLSKAFKLQYGFSPTQYRNDKDKYIMKREIINHDLALKAPKILDLEPKSVLYVSLTGTYLTLDYEGAYQQLWAVVKEQKLFTKGIESICVFYDDPKVTESSLLRSDVCLVIHKEAQPSQQVSCKTVAGGRYAVFHYQGSYDHLSEVYDTALRWIVSGGYELRDEPMFEKYLNDSRRTPAEKLKTEVYIPIK